MIMGFGGFISFRRFEIAYLDSDMKLFCCTYSTLRNDNPDRGIVRQGKDGLIRCNGEHMRPQTTDHHICGTLSDLGFGNREKVVRKIVAISFLEV